MAPSTSMDPSQPPSTRPAAAVLTTHTAPPTSSSRTASNSAIRASTASFYLPTRCVIMHGGSRRACVLAPLHTCWPGYMWVCMYVCMNACMHAYMLGRRRRKGACHLLPPAGEVISHICSRFAEGVRRLVVGHLSVVSSPSIVASTPATRRHHSRLFFGCSAAIAPCSLCGPGPCTPVLQIEPSGKETLQAILVMAEAIIGHD